MQQDISKKQNTTKNSISQNKNKTKDSCKDKINLDYDWNSEYGDGDIPDVDKL